MKKKTPVRELHQLPRFFSFFLSVPYFTRYAKRRGKKEKKSLKRSQKVPQTSRKYQRRCALLSQIIGMFIVVVPVVQWRRFRSGGICRIQSKERQRFLALAVTKTVNIFKRSHRYEFNKRTCLIVKSNNQTFTNFRDSNDIKELKELKDVEVQILQPRWDRECISGYGCLQRARPSALTSHRKNARNAGLLGEVLRV